MNIQASELKSLFTVQNTTSGTATGSYTDLQGFVTGRNFKAILIAGAGTTAGTCGGYIQSASDTSGTGVTTRVTFSGLTSAGGSEEAHFVVNDHRYVRFVRTVQSTKDMYMGCVIVGEARVRP